MEEIIFIFFCIVAFLFWIFIWGNATEFAIKTRYCHTLEAEYHDIRENGVCILPSGEVKDIDF